MPGSHLEGPDLENAKLTVIPAPVLIRENECGSESTALKLMTVFNKKNLRSSRAFSLDPQHFREYRYCIIRFYRVESLPVPVTWSFYFFSYYVPVCCEN